MAFEDFYNMNPVAVIDQNLWTDKVPEILMQFQTGPSIYTPLVDWMDRSQQTGAQFSQFFEVLEGDVNFDPIAITAEYIPQPAGVDSRMRQLTVSRFGDKVQLHESDNIFQMWRSSGGRDWRPLLRGVLGNNVKRKIELLSRNAYLAGPKNYWTFANGKSSFKTLGDSDTFALDAVNAWNLRLGNLGSPVIPGVEASVKLAMLPPGAIYDFFNTLSTSSKNEASMWRDSFIYGGERLKYEIGMFKNVRFVEHPNDHYGVNNAVLYNAGKVKYQYGVSAAINSGDGAPDPTTSSVDGTWYVGQKGATHYVQLDANPTGISVNDMVSIHIKKQTDSTYFDTDAPDFLSGTTLVRRVIAIDSTNYRLSFDRPIMMPFTTSFTGTPKTTSQGTIYAYVTSGQHIGFGLVLGSRGGIMGNVNRPLRFYEPRPVDDFDSVWRYVWDIVAGYNIWEPHMFECHFFSVSLPKPGGVISPVSVS